MRRPIIAGNWKMNKTVGEAKALVGALIPLGKGCQGRSSRMRTFCMPARCGGGR